MTYITNKDFALEVSKGNVPGHYAVNKFGEAPDGVQTTATDIWDLADATTTQQIWLAPTAARVHALVSTNTNDTNSSGTGARTVTVWGLPDWDTAETSETVALNGTTPVNTSGSYVIIHRMSVVTFGASGPNLGTITATAATDGTVTAAILTGNGQTQMAIYGVPSTQTMYITNFTATLITSGVNPSSSNETVIRGKFAPDPENNPTVFITKRTQGIMSTANSDIEPSFDPRLKLTGPGILKMQAFSSVADTRITATFDGYLVDN